MITTTQSNSKLFDPSAPDANPNREQALLYANEFGWCVFPCYKAKKAGCSCRLQAECDTPGKHPRKRLGGRKGGGLLAATDSPGRIRDWWSKWPTANVAVRTGNRFLVIDVDPRHGGYESLAALEVELGVLPRNMVVRTGGGGRHIYLSVPSGVRLASPKGGSAQGLAPGIDVQACGAYVIAPPSSHVSGEHYRWEAFSPEGPPAIPAAWLERLPRAAPADHNRTLADDAKRATPPAASEFNTQAKAKVHWRRIDSGYVATDEVTGEVSRSIPVGIHYGDYLRTPAIIQMEEARAAGLERYRARKQRREQQEQGEGSGAQARQREEQAQPILSVALLQVPVDQAERCSLPVRAVPANTAGLLDPRTETGRRAWVAARRCVVTGSSQTNVRFPSLATGLKNIPVLRDASAEELLPVVFWWYDQSCDHMQVKDWERVKNRWFYLWKRWGKPGVGLAWKAAAAVVTEDLLRQADASRPAGKFVLRAICTEMQRRVENRIWYLSCRTAADLLSSLGYEVDHTTVSRWLKQLVAEGFLVKPWEHERGSLKAQRFQTAAAAARYDRFEGRGHVEPFGMECSLLI